VAKQKQKIRKNKLKEKRKIQTNRRNKGSSKGKMKELKKDGSWKRQENPCAHSGIKTNVSTWIGRFLNSILLNATRSRSQSNRCLFKTISLQSTDVDHATKTTSQAFQLRSKSTGASGGDRVRHSAEPCADD
jgi:hypothetical protein